MAFNNSIFNNSDLTQNRNWAEDVQFSFAPLHCLLFCTPVFITKSQVRTISKRILLPLLSIILSILIFPLILGIITFFSTIRALVHFYLKFKHKKSFNGLLPGSDAIWATQDVSKPIISILTIIQSDEPPEKFKQHIQNDVITKLIGHPSGKLRSTLHKELGYNFLLENPSNFFDCMEIISCNGELNEKTVKTFVSEYSNVAMPKNDSALWQILLFDKQIEWQGRKSFAVIFRVHHSLADGFGLIRFVMEHLTNDAVGHEIMLPSNKSCKNRVREWCTILGAILFGTGILLAQTVLRADDANLLHGPRLSGEKILTFACEREKHLVAMVKKVKRKFNGMKFADVVFAGVAASFRDYYQKNKNIPGQVSAVIPAVLSINTKKNAMQNAFSLAILNLPLTSRLPTRKFLNKIKNEMQALRNSPDFIVNYWLVPIVAAVLPEPLLRRLVSTARCTMVISCLPGPQKFKLLQNNEIRDVIFWVPHRFFTGVGVSMLTYDDRFQLGLSVDRALVRDEDAAQQIIEAVVRHIENMCSEVIL